MLKSNKEKQRGISQKHLAHDQMKAGLLGAPGTRFRCTPGLWCRTSLLLFPPRIAEVKPLRGRVSLLSDKPSVSASISISRAVLGFWPVKNLRPQPKTLTVNSKISPRGSRDIS